ncbi:MAG TPA: alkaline phosphatase family protein [Thermoanaerobaculia bacterium]|nr:alkaline phosphatase family protein [Thermoanaerobaculia bacterium]
MNVAAAALIVVISIDQMRYDYLQRFDPFFTTRGFKRFTTIGATFTNARPRHSVTSTGPGHAAIGGGTVPRENGIVANRWLDRTATFDQNKWDSYFAETSPYGTTSTTTTDATPWYASSPYSPLFANEGALTPTLGDLLQHDQPESQVVSLALTDRAAILMGGKSADATYWFDHRRGGFVPQTSFNELIPGYIPASQQWTPMVPRETLERITFDPPEAWPLKNSLYNATFPHPIANIRSLQSTPFAHAMLFDFAQQLIAERDLGGDEAPDLLYVSISSTDYLGHLYGPDSMEVADSMVRLDRALGDFLDALDRRLAGRVIVALTSDHGIQALPEIAKLRDPRADAGRIDLRVPQPAAQKIRDLPPLRIELERRLARALRLPFSLDAPLRNALVFFFEEPTLYLNDARIAELRLDPARVAVALRDAARTIDGVANAWTVDDPNLPLVVRNTLVPTRSGEVVLTLKPGWIWMWGSNSTTHGQPVEADQHVPLMLYGPGIQPGTYDEEAAPMDLAKSLGVLLDIEAGGRQSRVLPCITRYDSRP